jgi:hemerythrin-like domain-containing protein
MRTLYDELRVSHDVQRQLCRSLTAGRSLPQNRKECLLALADELAAHAAAEERFLYAPLLMTDGGLAVSRHALSEHHELDELVEELLPIDPASDEFREKAKVLAHEVRHHLDEEEQGFFQLSGRLLSDSQKTSLRDLYVADYQRMKEKLANE